jgi:hypothetical protein
MTEPTYLRELVGELQWCPCCGRRQIELDGACGTCWSALDDLLNPDNRGSVFNADRPASIPVLIDQLELEPGGPPAPGGRRAPGFFSCSPARDEVIALQDPRSRSTAFGRDDEEDAPALVEVFGLLGDRTFAELFASDDVREVVRQLRKLRNHLLTLTGDAPPRVVGSCRELVDDQLRPLDAHDPRRVLVAAGQVVPAVYTCSWPLYAPAGRPRGDDEAMTVTELPAIRCGSCGKHYGGAALFALGRAA